MRFYYDSFVLLVITQPFAAYQFSSIPNRENRKWSTWNVPESEEYHPPISSTYLDHLSTKDSLQVTPSEKSSFRTSFQPHVINGKSAIRITRSSGPPNSIDEASNVTDFCTSTPTSTLQTAGASSMSPINGVESSLSSKSSLTKTHNGFSGVMSGASTKFSSSYAKTNASSMQSEPMTANTSRVNGIASTSTLMDPSWQQKSHERKNMLLSANGSIDKISNKKPPIFTAVQMINKSSPIAMTRTVSVEPIAPGSNSNYLANLTKVAPQKSSFESTLNSTVDFAETFDDKNVIQPLTNSASSVLAVRPPLKPGVNYLESLSMSQNFPSMRMIRSAGLKDDRVSSASFDFMKSDSAAQESRKLSNMIPASQSLTAPNKSFSVSLDDNDMIPSSSVQEKSFVSSSISVNSSYISTNLLSEPTTFPKEKAKTEFSCTPKGVPTYTGTNYMVFLEALSKDKSRSAQEILAHVGNSTTSVAPLLSNGKKMPQRPAMVATYLDTLQTHSKPTSVDPEVLELSTTAKENVLGSIEAKGASRYNVTVVKQPNAVDLTIETGNLDPLTNVKVVSNNEMSQKEPPVRTKSLDFTKTNSFHNKFKVPSSSNALSGHSYLNSLSSSNLTKIEDLDNRTPSFGSNYLESLSISKDLKRHEKSDIQYSAATYLESLKSAASATILQKEGSAKEVATESLESLAFAMPMSNKSINVTINEPMSEKRISSNLNTGKHHFQEINFTKEQVTPTANNLSQVQLSNTRQSLGALAHTEHAEMDLEKDKMPSGANSAYLSQSVRYLSSLSTGKSSKSPNLFKKLSSRIRVPRMSFRGSYLDSLASPKSDCVETKNAVVTLSSDSARPEFHESSFDKIEATVKPALNNEHPTSTITHNDKSIEKNLVTHESHSRSHSSSDLIVSLQQSEQKANKFGLSVASAKIIDADTRTASNGSTLLSENNLKSIKELPAMKNKTYITRTSGKNYPVRLPSSVSTNKTDIERPISSHFGSQYLDSLDSNLQTPKSRFSARQQPKWKSLTGQNKESSVSKSTFTSYLDALASAKVLQDSLLQAEQETHFSTVQSTFAESSTYDLPSAAQEYLDALASARRSLSFVRQPVNFIPKPVPHKPIPSDILAIRKQPKPVDEESKLAAKYAAIEDVSERAFKILTDLKMVELTPDPNSPDYDSSQDNDYVSNTVYR